MKLFFLDPLYQQPGPVACAYLDTSRDIDDPDEAIRLRRRHLCEALTEQGADSATVNAVADAVGTDQDIAGRHGQAVFASRGRLLMVEELPDPPVYETARYTTLPDTMPLVLQHAPDIPYIAVLVTHTDHREGEARGIPEEVEVEFQAGRWPSSSVAPEPSQRRTGPAADWPRGAGKIAGELEELAHRNHTETIVLAGPPWARGVLANRMPKHLRDGVTTIPAPEPTRPHSETLRMSTMGRALLERELSELFRGRLSAHDRMRIETFLAQRARHGRASEGLPAVVAALQRGQAEALLLNTPVELPDHLWAGSEPTEIALSATELHSFGVPSFQAAPADAVLIRALVGTGAELIAVPRQELSLRDGAGVLLRYANPGTQA